MLCSFFRVKPWWISPSEPQGHVPTKLSVPDSKSPRALKGLGCSELHLTPQRGAPRSRYTELPPSPLHRSSPAPWRTQRRLRLRRRSALAARWPRRVTRSRRAPPRRSRQRPRRRSWTSRRRRFLRRSRYPRPLWSVGAAPASEAPSFGGGRPPLWGPPGAHTLPAPSPSARLLSPPGPSSPRRQRLPHSPSPAPPA